METKDYQFTSPHQTDTDLLLGDYVVNSTGEIVAAVAAGAVILVNPPIGVFALSLVAAHHSIREYYNTDVPQSVNMSHSDYQVIEGVVDSNFTF